MAGLAVDVGNWYQFRREMQTAADAAALAGAYEKARGSNAATRDAAALTEAERNGFVNTPPAELAVNNPPTSGPNSGNSLAVEAIINAPAVLYLSSLFLDQEPNVQVRGVARVEASGEACVLALDTAAAHAANFTGNSYSNFINCWVAANSTNSCAIEIQGSGILEVDSLWTSGGYCVSGAGTLDEAFEPVTHSWPLPDPYAALTIPSVNGIPSLTACTAGTTNFAVGANTTVTMSPGTYCRGIDIRGTAEMLPGTYYIDRGDFIVNSQAVVSCPTCDDEQGVTIILTRTTSDTSQIGQVRINGGATVTLSAPEEGPYEGVLFYQDRRASNTVMQANQFNGGATMNLTGAMYFPRQEIEFSGNNTVNMPECTRIVGRLVTFTGTSGIQDTGCEELSDSDIDIDTVKLVE